MRLARVAGIPAVLPRCLARMYAAPDAAEVAPAVREKPQTAAEAAPAVQEEP
ncbi:hypothetical protein [Actinoplanes sp. NPDC026670]|uniref:hypothetical protein n=1 Tax=Actinoplanes sp. NPDC026670 TaxID=3154700 RepID=UPI0033F1971E